MRKEFKTKSGDWNPITGFRKLRTSGAEYRYTEAERNEIARVMAAERAFQKNERTKDGKRIAVYGGQLRRNADGTFSGGLVDIAKVLRDEADIDVVRVHPALRFPCEHLRLDLENRVEATGELSGYVLEATVRRSSDVAG